MAKENNKQESTDQTTVQPQAKTADEAEQEQMPQKQYDIEYREFGADGIETGIVTVSVNAVNEKHAFVLAQAEMIRRGSKGFAYSGKFRLVNSIGKVVR